MVRSTIDAFLAKYALTSEKHAMLDLTDGNLFDAHVDTELLAVKTDIFINARNLYLKHIPEISIKTSPSRVVIVNRAYNVGALNLVMAFPSIKAVQEGKKKDNGEKVEVPHGSYSLKGHGQPIKLWVSPSLSKDLVIPAWWCATAPTKAESTATVQWVEFSGYEYPCLVNTVKLAVGDEVIRHLPPKTVVKTAMPRALQLPEYAAKSKKRKT